MKPVVGCLASLAWFGLIAFAMLGTMMGDCFPTTKHTCPTDHERNVAVLVILFGGVVIYLLATLIIVRLSRRTSGE